MEMKSKPAQRYRVCGTPVRTGCITCKIRRIKCGEEKPCCLRCTSTGRKCDGYATIITPTKTTSPSPRRPSTSHCLASNEDAVEQSTLNFFNIFTAPKLSGSFSSDFWERTVFQAATTEPCIRHGAIALGAAHQDLVSRYNNRDKSRDVSIQAFAFRQYTKAITHLHQLMATRAQQLDITLIACILFISFDCLMGNHSSAIIHLKAGLKILEDIKLRDPHRATFSPTLSTQQWEREYSPLLLALGVQAVSFVDLPQDQEDRNALWTALRRAGVEALPTIFTSLDESRHALDTLAAEILRTKSCITSEKGTEESVPDRSDDRRYSAALQSWGEALELSLPNIMSTTASVARTQSGTTMLRIQAQFLLIVIGVPEFASDNYEKLLDLCETLVSTRNDPAGSPSPLIYSINMGIIGPLCFTAWRAPQETTQRRAYSLLSQVSGREGMWDTGDALRRAGEVIRITSRAKALGEQGSPKLC